MLHPVCDMALGLGTANLERNHVNVMITLSAGLSTGKSLG
jgi:hypothetical protein